MTNISTGVYQADEGKVFFCGDTQLGNMLYLGINDSIENYTEGVPVDENLINAQETKCQEINEKCQETITAGIDVGDKHYTLTTNDQINIGTMGAKAQTGASVPYHADGEKCKMYTAQEFLQVYATAMYHITYNTTYCNLLKSEVNEMTSSDTVNAVVYGTTQLNTENQTILNNILASLQDSNNETA